MPIEEESGMVGESQEPRALTVHDDRKTYKSPQRKLVEFFAQSRDQWKGKCREAKASLKQLKKKLQRGEERQRRQKQQVHALASEVARLQAEKRRLEEALAVGEKKAR
jgi:chromosome segregation ATPase